MFAELVEALDLMKETPLSNVGVRAEAERVGDFGGVVGVSALVARILAADGDWSLSFELFPRGVDLGRWRLL